MALRWRFPSYLHSTPHTSSRSSRPAPILKAPAPYCCHAPRSRQRLHAPSSSSSHAPRTPSTCPEPQPSPHDLTRRDEVLQQLATAHGIFLGLHLGASSIGQPGLFWNKALGLSEGVSPRLEPASRHPAKPQRNPDPPTSEPAAASSSSLAPRPQLCSTEQDLELVLSVPVHLVLSMELPGSCPAAAQVCRTIPDHLPWEIRLGALMLWACSPPPAEPQDIPGDSGHVLPPPPPRLQLNTHSLGSSSSSSAASSPPISDHSSHSSGGLRRFWSAYYEAFIPPATSLTSLLLYSTEELEQLQDATLAATALSWQEEVRDAYFALTAEPSAYISLCGQLHSLRAFTAAVAAVESRAFGVKVGGQMHQAMVPCFDLVNHSFSSASRHCVGDGRRLTTQQSAPAGPADGYPGSSTHGPDSAATGSVSSEADAKQDDGSRGLSGELAGAGAPCGMMSLDMYGAPPGWSEAESDHVELLTSYGEKSNRQLMEQYGFSVPGNPFDRLEDLLQLPLPAPQGSSGEQGVRRLRRDKVRGAAEAVVAQVLRGAGAGEEPGGALRFDGGTGAVAAACSVWPGGEAAHASRVRAAAAGIIKAFGWRSQKEYQGITMQQELGILTQLEQEVDKQLQGMQTSAEQVLQLLHGSCAGAGGVKGGGDGSFPAVRPSSAAAAYLLERKLSLLAVAQLAHAVRSLITLGDGAARQAGTCSQTPQGTQV